MAMTLEGIVVFVFSLLFFSLFFLPSKLNRPGRAFVADRQRGKRLDKQRTGSLLLFSERLDVLFWEWGGRLYDEPLLGLVDDTTRQRSDIE